jgi:hypothetical protein
MSKKASPTKLLTKNNIISGLAILAFVGTALSWIYFISYVQYMNEQNRVNAEQFFELSMQTARQQYCLENLVSPCTQETINTHAETESEQ